MRTEEPLWQRLGKVPRWKDTLGEALRNGASWSGYERNHYYLNLDGEEFFELSGVSGLDSIADSRAYGMLDFDRDGWVDVALVNSNDPQFELFHNRLGARLDRSFVAVRLVGGNRTPGPSEWSNRDGVGSLVIVRSGGFEQRRELKAGEGFAAQNSSTLVIGLGAASQADSVEVRWPSGRTQELVGVEAGTLLTVYENPDDGPGGEAFHRQTYRADPGGFERLRRSTRSSGPSLPLAPPAAGPAPALHLYTLMATWCVPCRAEVPDLEELRRWFEPSQVAMFGVPIDPAEGRELLERWAAEVAPPYELLLDLPAERGEAVLDHLVASLGSEAIPASIVTTADGRVLHTQWGPPSVSELRRLLAELESTGAPERAAR